MKLALTPSRIAAVYAMLREMPPFCRWKLPAPSEVKFGVIRTDRWYADHGCHGGRHVIRVSQAKHHTLDGLVRTVAHEVIHMHQSMRGTETKGAEHNAEFRRIAARVCQIHAWDGGSFLG